MCEQSRGFEVNVDRVTVDNGKATAPSLVRVFSVNMCNSITRWCWGIFDHWGIIRFDPRFG